MLFLSKRQNKCGAIFPSLSRAVDPSAAHCNLGRATGLPILLKPTVNGMGLRASSSSMRLKAVPTSHDVSSRRANKAYNGFISIAMC